MATANATKTSAANVMQYEDPVVQDELFGTVVRGIFWGGFGALVVTRLGLAILNLAFYFEVKSLVLQGSQSPQWPGSLDTLAIFGMLDALATVVFAGGLVVSALVASRMPSWARVTMLCVSAVVLVGTNAVAGFSLTNLLFSLGR